MFLVFYPQVNNNHASTFCKCKSNPFRKFSHSKNPFFISKNIWKILGKEVLQSRFFVNLWTYGLQISKNYFPWRMCRSSHPEVFLRKGVLKICCKFTGEHQCRSVILIKLLSNFIEITLQHECSAVNLLHIFRTPFFKNTSGGLLANILEKKPRLLTYFTLMFHFYTPWKR